MTVFAPRGIGGRLNPSSVGYADTFSFWEKDQQLLGLSDFSTQIILPPRAGP